MHYTYKTVHEGNMPYLYLWMDEKSHEPFLAFLGKHKALKGCIYINKLADIDINVLKESIVVTEVQMEEFVTQASI